jgi:hypothetical protein
VYRLPIQSGIVKLKGRFLKYRNTRDHVCVCVCVCRLIVGLELLWRKFLPSFRTYFSAIRKTSGKGSLVFAVHVPHGTTWHIKTRTYYTHASGGIRNHGLSISSGYDPLLDQAVPVCEHLIFKISFNIVFLSIPWYVVRLNSQRYPWNLWSDGVIIFQ